MKSEPVLTVLTVSLLAFVESGNTSVLCPSGCYCSSEEVAHCCLFSSTESSSSLQCSLTGRKQVSANANPLLRWPAMDTCPPKWTELSVQLSSPDSWPVERSKRPCTAQLRRIALSGRAPTFLRAQDFEDLFGSQENQLRVLTIEHTPLESIEAGFFDRLSLKSLAEIHIRHNQNLTYKGFGVSVFSSLPQLETLNLESNRIERVDFVRWGFPAPSRLVSLNLASNSLTYLKPGGFALFPFLKTLSLANNRLSSLSSDVFEGLTSLVSLDLSGNLLNLMGLKDSVPGFSIILANLQTLDMSMNPLMRNVYSESTKWWLSSGCPFSLTHLHMNHVDVDAGQEMPLLPPIDWVRCQKLVHVEIQQIPRLPCIPSTWLKSAEFPEHPRLITSATRICFPITTTTTTTTTLTTAMVTVAPSLVNITSTSSAPSFKSISEHLGLRELIVSSVVGGVLFILIILLIAIVFMCRRKRWSDGSRFKTRGKANGGTNGFDAVKRERPMISSTYIPATDCHLQLADNMEDDGEMSASSLRTNEARILYDETGQPVCSMVMPDSCSPTPVFLSDGTAIVPQYVTISSGRATPSSHTGLLDNGSAGNFRRMVKSPIVVPLMASHASLATSQIEYRQPAPTQFRQPSRSRPRAPNHHPHHQHSGNGGQAPASSLSCKSTSFSSLGGSIHSEIPVTMRDFRASPPVMATIVQPTKPVISNSSTSSNGEEPSLMAGVGNTASTTTSTANPSPSSHSDEAVA